MGSITYRWVTPALRANVSYWVLGWGWFITTYLVSSVTSDGSEIVREAERLRDDFNAQVRAIADQATSSEVANQIKDYLLVRDPSRSYFYAPEGEIAADPPQSVDRRATAAADRPLPTEIASALQRATAQQAAALHSLVDRALAKNDGSTAFQLLHEILYFAPDDPVARRFLGLPDPGRSANSSIELRRGRRAHPRYGWPASGYWQITTPHFLITTNGEQATALELAQVLERLHNVWRQLFFDRWCDAGQLRSWGEGRARRTGSRRRHQVVLCHTRDDYLRILQPLEPRAELTRGYYHAASQVAFFVGGEPGHAATWLHEGTHQLFAETGPTARGIGSRHNVWMIEGIALYMESLQACGRWQTVGGLEADRLQYARFRTLRSGQDLPLAELTQLDQQSLQQHPEIRGLYSQAAGVSHFLMHDQQGRWRPALINYLAEIYAGRDQPDSLARLTGVPLSQLEAAYREFLQVDDSGLAQLDPHARIQNLCLGGTAITDRGLLSLPSLAEAEWIDLYGTQITDAGTEPLAHARALRQLSLERTQIGDLTVARLAAAGQLQQLDLSATRVTDQALDTVSRLTQLDSLWLSGTAITDAGLPQLRSLRRLCTLDLSATAVTPAAQDQLAAELPEWQRPAGHTTDDAAGSAVDGDQR